MATGATYTADVLGYNSAKDVALLQLEDASGLTAIATEAGSLTTVAPVTSVGDANGDGDTPRPEPSLTCAPPSPSPTRPLAPRPGSGT